MSKYTRVNKSAKILIGILLSSSLILGACETNSGKTSEDSERTELLKGLDEYSKEGKVSGEKVKEGEDLNEKYSYIAGYKYDSIEKYIKDYTLLYGNPEDYKISKGQAIAEGMLYGYSNNTVNAENLQQIYQEQLSQYENSIGKKAGVKEQRRLALTVTNMLGIELYYAYNMIYSDNYNFEKISDKDREIYGVVTYSYDTTVKGSKEEAVARMNKLKTIEEVKDAYDKNQELLNGGKSFKNLISYRSYLISDKNKQKNEEIFKGLKEGKVKKGDIIESKKDANGEQNNKNFRYVSKVIYKAEANDEVIKIAYTNLRESKLYKKYGDVGYIIQTLYGLQRMQPVGMPIGALSSEFEEEIRNDIGSYGISADTIYGQLLTRYNDDYEDMLSEVSNNFENITNYYMPISKEGAEDATEDNTSGNK